MNIVHIRNEIYEALKAECEGMAEVFDAYPQSWETLPCVSFYQEDNVCFARAGSEEHLSEVIYRIDIWSDSTAANDAIAEKVETAMAALGLRRKAFGDVGDADKKHTTVSYRGVLDQQKHVYQ